MKSKKEKAIPMLRTIPDDMQVFSLLNLDYRIIMENYINFYSFRELEYNYIVLRFEDFMNVGNFEGIDHCFIPIDIMKEYSYDLRIIKELIERGYLITLPVSRRDIPFYTEEPEGGHLITIYGIEKEIFLCKDFKGHDFIEFEVSIKEMQNGLFNYHRMYPKESGGLLAMRLNDNCDTKIDYSKVFSQFWKLKQDYFTDNHGFGIGALNLVAVDIKERYKDFFNPNSWYDNANYMRESSKLMNIRYDILQEEIKGDKNSEGRLMLEKLEKDTEKLFFNIEKKIYKGKELTRAEFEKFYYLFWECKEDFRKIAELFCREIEQYLK